MKKNALTRILALICAMLCLAGCASTTVGTEEISEENVYLEAHPLSNHSLEQEMSALADSIAAIDLLLLPKATGELVKSNEKAVIDYSNTSDGYVMINFTASTTKRLKVKITGPSSVDYTYNLTAGKMTTFPLSDGNGSYTIKVYENTTGNKYAAVLSLSTSVVLNDEFAPFLRPNQYVNYTASTKAVAKATELCANAPTALDKVGVIYDYVVKNYTYDKEKAATVQSGYLPDLDKVMAAKKGICFDYAALMTAMLRSQNVPCKLVVGYAGTAYHAWINVWSENTGWVEGVVYFDGTAWQRMDPTFASSGKQSASIMKYIGDGKNYTEKYLY